MVCDIPTSYPISCFGFLQPRVCATAREFCWSLMMGINWLPERVSYNRGRISLNFRVSVIHEPCLSTFLDKCFYLLFGCRQERSFVTSTSLKPFLFFDSRNYCLFRFYAKRVFNFFFNC